MNGHNQQLLYSPESGDEDDGLELKPPPQALQNVSDEQARVPLLF